MESGSGSRVRGRGSSTRTTTRLPRRMWQYVMSTSDWWGLLSMFLGGAFPWLEAVIVIPGGIIAGLPVVPVVIAAVTGNLTTIALAARSEEHTSELQSRFDLLCRLLLEKTNLLTL